MRYRFLNKVEFYITNVCNLNCNNCNRFNNYNFKGFQRWSDHAETYQRWSQFIELQSIVLMGGEPLLNPTVKEWILGLLETFGCDVQILTNGYHLNRVPGLYDTVAPYANNLKNYAHFQVSLHNTDQFDFIRQEIVNFLKPPIKEWGTFLGTSAPEFHRDYRAYYTAQDKNNVQINLHIDNHFSTSAVQLHPDGRYRLHDSNPQQAHNVCGFVKWKSYHFIAGKIYKCGPSALLPEFDRQFGLDISDEERKVLNSYQPFTVEQVATQGAEILAQIDHPIAQCRFCPTQLESNIIWAQRKNSMNTDK